MPEEIEKRKIQAWVDKNLHQKVKGYAGFMGVDVQEFVTVALESYLEKLESGNSIKAKNIIKS
jgi:hypothetical protein